MKGKWLTIKKDGREIIDLTKAGGRDEYDRRKLAMWARDNFLCCLCGRYLPLGQMTFEHKQSRGMGGCFRDDRIEKNGVSHYLGNVAKGSMNYDRYMELPLEQRISNCMGV